MDSYKDNLRKVKSLLIVTSLQKRNDEKAFEIISNLMIDLEWDRSELAIDDDVWNYITKEKKYDPKFVFCHPDVVRTAPLTALYYRCLTGLSIKAAKEYIGSIENLENGSQKKPISREKALLLSSVYNTFICTTVKGSSDWTLEDGHRTIIATLGITLDGVMRNKVGAIAEERVRTLIYEWLKERGLIIFAAGFVPTSDDKLPVKCQLINNVIMRFSAEPDVAFVKQGNDEELLAVIEIKGGIDPAGALERYGAATKSFQHAQKESQRCKNFFLSAVFTPELKSRITNDRLVDKFYDIIEILEDPVVREDFFTELFHYSLRLT